MLETGVGKTHGWRLGDWRRTATGLGIGLTIAGVLIALSLQMTPLPRTSSAIHPAAGLVTLGTPFGNPITISPVTWNVGAGTFLWNIPTGATPGSGAVVFDPHMTAGPGPGTQGTDSVEAGFAFTYTCTGLCPGDTTATFNWYGTWYTQITLNCNGATQAEFTLYAQVWVGANLLGQTTVTPSNQLSTTNPSAPPAATGAMPTPAVLPAGGFAGGITYTFVTYIWGESYTNCTGGTGPAYSEVDVGGRYPVHLTNVQLT